MKVGQEAAVLAIGAEQAAEMVARLELPEVLIEFRGQRGPGCVGGAHDRYPPSETVEPWDAQAGVAA